jgi:hypothetical protein
MHRCTFSNTSKKDKVPKILFTQFLMEPIFCAQNTRTLPSASAAAAAAAVWQ